MGVDLMQYAEYVEWLEKQGFLNGFKVKVKAKIYGIDHNIYKVDTIGYLPKNPKVDSCGNTYVAFLEGYGPTSAGKFTLCGANMSISKLLKNVIQYPTV